MSRLRTKGKSTIVWLLMGMLILGLGGFGVTNFSGGTAEVGTVGSVEISDQDYARTLQLELRNFAARTGRNLTPAEAQSFGIQQAALAQLFALAALEDEAKRLGVSVGDAAVGEQLAATQAFSGLDGKFSRDVYNETLRRENMRPAEFEHDLRMDEARKILYQGVVSGVRAPETLTNKSVAWLLETRDIHWSELTVEDLPVAVTEPDEATLQAWHQANADRFTAPETRKISYVWLTPEMLENDVQVDEQALRDLYQQRLEEFQQPERRMVERLVFLNEADASAAKARVDSGELSFEALVAERGLTLNDIDLGEVSEAELGAAGPDVFALDQPGLVGPLPSPQGPSLFAMNAILEPMNITFEQALPDLRVEAAIDRARRTITDQSQEFTDMLAGGATLEDMAEQTQMELGQIDWTNSAEPGPGSIGTYPAFREHAETVTEADFPELFDLGDGGVFALQLTEVVAPHLIPFEEVRERVAADWVQNETHRQLLALGDERRLADGSASEAVNAPASAAATGGAVGHGVANSAAGTTGAAAPATDAPAADVPAAEPERGTEVLAMGRGDMLRGLPQDLVSQAFEIAEPGDTEVVDAENRVFLVTLDKINTQAAEGTDIEIVQQGVDSRLSESMRQDLFDYYTRAIQNARGATVNQTAVDAVNAMVQ